MVTRIETPAILTPALESQAIAYLRSYFLGVGNLGPFTGASFETIGHAWNEPPTANEITSGDLLSLATLSVEAKGSAVVTVLGDAFQDKATSLLAQIPLDVSIVDPDADALFAEHGAAQQLWTLVRGVKSFGRTRTSKLLARKRPLLLPIYDAVVNEALGLGHGDLWLPLQELLRANGNEVYERAAALHDAARLPAVVTPLRVVDVAVWRWGQDHRL